MKPINIFGVIILISMSFISGCYTIRNNGTNVPSTEYSEPIVAEANWVVDAVSVEEVEKKANLIVRVKAKSQIERVQEEIVPSYGFPNADPATPLEELDPDKIEEVGRHTIYTPFTETTFEVIKVYKGEASSTIVVSQLGGMLSPPSERGNDSQLSIEGNPIFATGSEHILFLVPLSHTKSDTDASTLFAVLGPPARYEIDRQQVFPPVDLSEFAGHAVDAPKTVTELEARIISDSKK